MNKVKGFDKILFWITLFSPLVSFALISVIGEANIFGVAGIIRYSWIMWFFIPLGILSILIGKKLKQCKQNYKKNNIIAFICLSLLIIFGSYRFIFSDVSYDTDKVTIIEKETRLVLPDRIKMTTNKFDTYSLSFLKIVDKESK